MTAVPEHVRARDTGAILTSLALKVMLLGGVVGLGAHEFSAVERAQALVQSSARSAASAAVASLTKTRSLDKAWAAALAQGRRDGIGIKANEFAVSRDGTVTLTVHLLATGSLLLRFDVTRSFTELSAQASSGTAASAASPL